ncbi:MAG TPA: hypothetical protein VEA99_03700 [Gemmatimonadaceae bacterium]|nr:hypothetical protein [Gemmatimonadaceae bacterium]
MPDAPQPPARRPPLDRAALERVLARAAELQLRQGDVPEAGESYENLSEEQLLEIGKEAGLSPQHLQLALAEERTRVAVSTPIAAGGEDALRSGIASASRTIAMRAPEVLAALDQWMQRKECLAVKRSMPERIVWEPGGGVLNAARRMLSGQGLALAGAHEVSATVVPVDERRQLVRLDANMTPVRAAATRDGVALGVVGAGGGAAAFAVGTVAAVSTAILLPLAIVPAVGLGALGWWQARRRFVRTMERAQLALEQILDGLERGELSRPTLLSALAAAANTLPRR